jgi:hypothetical protein
VKEYARYSAVVLPLLPAPVAKLCRAGLHDARIISAHQRGTIVKLVLDTSGALTDLRGGRVTLAFSGVRGRVRLADLAEDWWLYEEGHLSAVARFSFHVPFRKSELTIDADDLRITRVPPAPRSRRTPRDRD